MEWMWHARMLQVCRHAWMHVRKHIRVLAQHGCQHRSRYTRAARHAIALLDADLRGLLQIKEVSEELQAKLSVERVRSVSKLSTVADDRAGIRAFCQASLNLTAAANMVDIASIVDAWDRFDNEDESEAQSRS